MPRRLRVEHGFLGPSSFYTARANVTQWIKGEFLTAINIHFPEGYDLTRSQEQLAKEALKRIQNVTQVSYLHGKIAIFGKTRTRKQHEEVVREVIEILIKGLDGEIVEKIDTLKRPE